ncbi:tRNA m(1)G methyltransferase domain-containing protein [Diplocarpon rosae]|nr:tRNA m(1)G methyltransferase domain-containing protein [Diplocarpon rosae]
MADSEERPAKIRKIDFPDGSIEPVQAPSSSMALLDQPTQLNGQIEVGVEETTASQGAPPMSKTQLKKLKKREHWEAGKEYRKILQKEKQKEKQARKAKEREELKEKIAKGEIEKPSSVRKPGPRRPVQVPVSFVLDCDFNEFMMEKEIISLGAQLTRCYSDNKCNSYRAHLAVSSWGGKLRSRFETVLTNNHQSWKGVRFFDQDFETAAGELDSIMRGPQGGKLIGALATALVNVEGISVSAHAVEESLDSSTKSSAVQLATEVISSDAAVTVTQSQSEPPTEVPLGTDSFKSELRQPEETGVRPKPSIVYLTSDSPNTLDVLSPFTTYIIGGIVDKNRHKGLCYKRACERGIPTARLPIGEFMTMQSRTVLTVNHVVEIMLKWLETADWGEAFLKVIPKRKEARLRAETIGEQRETKSVDESEDERENEDGADMSIATEKSDVIEANSKGSD